MATPDDHYTAWDGRRYRGEPPAGWYLAADNRWWPNRDLIDGAGQATPDHASGAAPAEPADHRPGVRGRAADPGSDIEPGVPGTGRWTSDAGRRPASRPPVPDQSWAPEPGGPFGPAADPAAQSPPPPPAPTSAAGTGPGAPWQAPFGNRGRRRRGGVPGFLIFFLIFALFRCSSATFDGDGPADFGPVPTLPPTVQVQEPAIEEEPQLVLDSRQLTLWATSCRDGLLALEAENASGDVLVVEVELTIALGDGSELLGAPDDTITATIGPVAPGPGHVQSVELPVEAGHSGDCEVIDARIIAG